MDSAAPPTANVVRSLSMPLLVEASQHPAVKDGWAVNHATFIPSRKASTQITDHPLQAHPGVLRMICRMFSFTRSRLWETTASVPYSRRRSPDKAFVHRGHGAHLPTHREFEPLFKITASPSTSLTCQPPTSAQRYCSHLHTARSGTRVSPFPCPDHLVSCSVAN